MAYGTGGSGCLGSVEVVTPHDTNPIAIGESRAIYIGTAGNLVCRMADNPGVDVTLPLGVGWHPIAVRLIKTTSTAAGILAGR